MATYLEYLLEKFDSATIEIQKLTRKDYTFDDIKNIIINCSSELEIFMKLAAFPSKNQRHSFQKYIDELITVGISEFDINILHKLREVYNLSKHNSEYEPKLLEIESLIRNVSSSLKKLTTLSFGQIKEQVTIRHRRILWFFAWDHYIGGDTEISIMIPSISDELPTELDHIYIEMSAWDIIKSELSLVGTVSFGKELFPEKIYEFFSNESDFLSGGIFEGEYKELLKTFAKYELRQELLYGLNRHDRYSLLFQSSILAMVEVVSTLNEEPTKENLITIILNSCINNYAVPSDYPRLSRLITSHAVMLKELDFSLWRALSGPTWINEASFNNEKEKALVINNELNILINKNCIVRIKTMS